MKITVLFADFSTTSRPPAYSSWSPTLMGLCCLYFSLTTTTTTAFTTTRSAASASSAITRRAHPSQGHDEIMEGCSIDRRGLFRQAAATVAALGTTTTFLPNLPANAGSLLQFPVGPDTQPLKNKYHFMRAGTSELEAEGIYSTNPLFLTNRENAMDAAGEKQVLNALEKMKTETELFPTIAYHSLAANGMDTGDLIARQLRLGREKLLPEFTYLDQRGVGMWDSADVTLVQPAVWALDYLEAGKFGTGGRPPANTDGTPNETLGDQFIRLRQFLSLQESRTSGDIILVIFPDGTGPALLSAMIAGIPFKDVHALEFAPGEVRLDITPESVRALFEEKKKDPEYLAILEDGKEKLATLLNRKSMVGLKEQKAEEERLAMEEEYALKKKEESLREQERLKRMADEKQLALDQKMAQKKAKIEQERLRKEEKAATLKAGLPETASSFASSQTTDNEGAVLAVAGAAVVGVSGLAAAILAIQGDGSGEKKATPAAAADDDDTKDPSSGAKISDVPTENQNTDNDPPGQSQPRAIETRDAPRTSLFNSPVPTISSMKDSTSEPNRSSASAQSTASGRSIIGSRNEQKEDALGDSMKEDVTIGDSVINAQLDQLAAAEQAMKDALSEAAAASTSLIRPSKSTDDDWDDGGDSWLNVLMEIRDEDDDEDDNDDNDNTPLADMVVNGDYRPRSGRDYSPKSVDL